MDLKEIPSDSYGFEVFHIGKSTDGEMYAYLGYKSSYGFNYITIPFTILDKDVNEYLRSYKFGKIKNK